MSKLLHVTHSQHEQTVDIIRSQTDVSINVKKWSCLRVGARYHSLCFN